MLKTVPVILCFDCTNFPPTFPLTGLINNGPFVKTVALFCFVLIKVIPSEIIKALAKLKPTCRGGLQYFNGLPSLTLLINAYRGFFIATEAKSLGI